MENSRADGSALTASDRPPSVYKYDNPGEIAPQNLKAFSEKDVPIYSDLPEVVVEAPRAWTGYSSPYETWRGPIVEEDTLPIVDRPRQQPSGPGRTAIGSQLSGRTFWAIVAMLAAIILAVGLGVGLGVGMGLRRDSSSASTASSPSQSASSSISYYLPDTVVCTEGIRYCGWDLIQSMSKRSPATDRPMKTLCVLRLPPETNWFGRIFKAVSGELWKRRSL